MDRVVGPCRSFSFGKNARPNHHDKPKKKSSLAYVDLMEVARTWFLARSRANLLAVPATELLIVVQALAFPPY